MRLASRKQGSISVNNKRNIPEQKRSYSLDVENGEKQC
jgi:hypothetical protein